MAHAQKPDFIFRRNGLVHLNRQGASVQSTTGSRGVRISVSNAGYTTLRGSVRVLTTHSIRQFPLHFPSRASPCAIRFQRHSTTRSDIRCKHAQRLIYPPQENYCLHSDDFHENHNRSRELHGHILYQILYTADEKGKNRKYGKNFFSAPKHSILPFIASGFTKY